MRCLYHITFTKCFIHINKYNRSKIITLNNYFVIPAYLFVIFNIYLFLKRWKKVTEKLKLQNISYFILRSNEISNFIWRQ